MAAEAAAEVKAEVAAKLNAAVGAALDAAFARQSEAILDAVIAMDRARASSATTPTSSPSDIHASAVALACASSSVQAALAAPTTCSTQCPSHDVTIGIVLERCEPEPAVATSTPISMMDVSGARAPPAVEPDFFTTLPTTSSVVCLDPIHVTPAAVLTQATLDIMDSSGFAALVAMSAQLDTPEGADTDVTHKDEQLLACSSVERPLALVAASDVADDHNFIIGTSAIPQTLATLSVDDGPVANEHKVLLPLRLLVPWSKSKEPYIARSACDKQSNANPSGSPDHHQKLWYAKTQEFTKRFLTPTSLKVLLLWGNFPGSLSTVNVNYLCTTRLMRYLNDKDFIAKECWPASPREQPIYAVYFWKDGSMWKCSGKTRYLILEMIVKLAVWQNGGVGYHLLALWHPGERAVGILCFALPPAKPPDYECILTLYSKTLHVFSSRLLTTWICDLTIARDGLCTTFRNARQLIGANISSKHQLRYRSTADFFCSNTHCEEIVQANLIAAGVGAWKVFCARFKLEQVYFLADMQHNNHKESLQTLILAFSKIPAVIGLGSLALHWDLALWSQSGSTTEVYAIQNFVEHLYYFSELSCCCEPWTSWQSTRIASSIYALLIIVKARDDLDIRPELSLQTNIFASNGCSIVLHNMTTFGSINRRLGLTVGNNPSYGAEYLEFMSYVPMHGCKLINCFHHEKLWDPGGIHSCSWIFPWLVVLVNCRSVPQWSPPPVNCHFSRMHIMLSRRSQMTEEFNSRTSLNLVVYGGYPAITLACTSSWRLMLAGFLLQYDLEADVILLVISGHQVTIRCVVQQYTSSSTFLAILNGRAQLQKHCTCMWAVTEAVQLLDKHSSRHHAILWRNRPAWFDHHATATTVWSLQLLELFGSSDQSDNVTLTYSGVQCFDHAYYFDKVGADQGYYIDIFLDQAHIGHDYYLVCVGCYLNIAKVSFHYDTHRDLGEAKKHQVPWDPGGSARHWLEVKPNFKEGRMLATYYPHRGLDHGLDVLGLGYSGATKPASTNTQDKRYKQLGLDQDGFGLHRFCLRLPFEFLFSSVMARIL